MRTLAVSIGVIILFVLGAFELFSGMLRSPFVHMRIRSYVARNYADFDLVVNRPSFHYAFQVFTSRVHDRTSPSKSFGIEVEGRELRDGFYRGGFWARSLSYMLTPLLEQEFGDGFRNVSAVIRGVQIGQQFDLTADVCIRLTVFTEADSPAPYVLAAQISRYHEFFVRNNFHFAEYNFVIEYPHFERRITIRMPPGHVNDELTATIEHARSNRNRNGVFSRNNFRYSSRVDFTPSDG